MQRVFIGIPTYDNTVSAPTMLAVLNATRQYTMQVCCNASSLLPHGFNILWAMAQKSGADYFVMLHADIGPDPDWLDVLIGDLEETKADILSAIVPIKSGENVYSTALCHAGQESHYRLHVNDLAELPPVFDGSDLCRVARSEGILCVNTGLWACRLQQEWNSEISFQIQSRIVWEADGTPYCRIIPEDWDFSQQAHALGLRVMATQRIHLLHCGSTTWQSFPGA